MAKKFVAPKDVSALDADALAAAVEEAYAAFDELAGIPDADVTDEQLAEMSELSGFVTAAKAENVVREEAAAARAEQLAAVRAEMAPVEDAAEAVEGDEEVAGEEDAAEEEEEAAAAPAQAASIQKPANFAARAARRAPTAPVVTVAPAAQLRAATGVPGFEGGQKFATLAEGAEVLQKRLNALPKSAPMGTRLQNSALVIELPSNHFSQANPEFSGKDSSEMLLAAADETRLTGKSLVAAGGWGAPSEQTLSFCELESIEGLISLPETTITRGGISYTKGPVFADVVANSTGFWDMTEAVAEAGTEQKTSLRPEIPTFAEERLDAVGVMMEAGLLLRQGWPEIIARYSKLLLTAHQYKLAQKSIAQIQAFTGPATPIANGFGNELDILHILELLAIGERQRNFMSPKQTLEALVPFWIKAAIRAGLAQRNGVDTISVTDAQIDGYFTARNIKVQWLNAYQNLTIDPTTKLAKDYPSTVEVIFYPAGTFVRGTAPVITLDTVYDSVNLKKNDYVELFVEQGVLMTNPCGEGRRVSIPLNINGRRAAVADANDNLFKAPVA